MMKTKVAFLEGRLLFSQSEQSEMFLRTGFFLANQGFLKTF